MKIPFTISKAKKKLYEKKLQKIYGPLSFVTLVHKAIEDIILINENVCAVHNGKKYMTIVYNKGKNKNADQNTENQTAKIDRCDS